MDPESIEEIMASKSSSGNFFPPGFRFHPTDEELVVYYLKRKICCRSIKPDVIAEVDVYKRDPEELPGQSKLKTRDRQWFFFSPRDKKYPNGGRSNRATMHGYWKATGKDRVIKCKFRSVGTKKTLVYHHGRAPAGQRTDWVMHEYTMDEEELKRCQSAQGNYALYKVFKKSGPGPKNGEQYGAPFVEEEWDNVDSLDLDALLVPNVSDDIVEMINNIREESDIVPPMPQISCVERSQNIDLVDPAIMMDPSQHNGDFLEMNDLIDPQPAVENIENLVLDNPEFACFDGLSEFDLYQDLDMFSELGQYESQQIQQPYDMNNLEHGTENSGYNSYSNYTGMVVNHQQLHDDHPINYGLWAHDERNTISAPSSGVVIDENLEKSDSWFSSALWAFVESMPTTPALASEAGALVDQALYRNVNEATAAGVNSVLASRSDKSSRSTRGIVYFSVLGVLFAILSVFIGTSMKLLAICAS